MKKGMCVTLSDGKEYNLVDSVSHNGDKFFAAVSNEENDETIYFFKGIVEGDEEFLEPINEDDYSEVINALKNHMSSTF